MEQDKEQLIDLFTDCIKKRRFVSDIDDNQVLLLDAINELRQIDEEFILDENLLVPVNN